MLTLQSGEARCRVHPDAGGALSCWAVGGQDMLRHANGADVKSGDPLRFACFPLIPYSNRIGHGRLIWEGREYQLRQSQIAPPHALHGVGFTRAWAIKTHSKDSAVLRLVHSGDDDWPFPFTAQQTVTVTENRLRLSLDIRNEAAHDVPVGGGFHPYFDRAQAVLEFDAETIWLIGEDGLPVKQRSPLGSEDFTNGAAVGGMLLDNAYAGWPGRATVAWAGRPRRAVISGGDTLDHAVVYVPDNESYFCFEPVSHTINALALGESMHKLAPGDTWRCQMDIKAISA